MTSPSVSDIKRAQKESLLLREISQLFLQASIDEKALQALSINRVKLSPDKGVCTVYFYTPRGQTFFDEILPVLKLYKPSLRKALSARIRARYTPELIFKYDEQYEKVMHIESLLEKVKREG
jgi:ribosome-binding factor A